VLRKILGTSKMLDVLLSLRIAVPSPQPHYIMGEHCSVLWIDPSDQGVVMPGRWVAIRLWVACARYSKVRPVHLAAEDKAEAREPIESRSF